MDTVNKVHSADSFDSNSEKCSALQDFRLPLCANRKSRSCETIFKYPLKSKKLHSDSELRPMYGHSFLPVGDYLKSMIISVLPASYLPLFAIVNAARAHATLDIA